MWDPKTYKDSDFGLKPEETYEPSGEDSDDFHPEPGEHYIRTVLGCIRPDETGLTLVAEHLHRDPTDAGSADEQLIDRDAALRDLESLFSVGGLTIVDATLARRGRDVGTLRWLAQRAPLNIVATTGLTLLSAWEDLSPEEARSKMQTTLARDVHEGMDSTSSLPGVLAVELDHSDLTGAVEIALDIVAATQQSTGLPLRLTSGTAESSVEALGEITADGVDLKRVTVGNLDEDSHEHSVDKLARHGAFLAFDHIGWHGHPADRRLAQRIAGLVDEGFCDQVLLSHGFQRRSQLNGYNGSPGLGYIVEQFALMLLEAGLDASDVRKMLADNAARALSIEQTPAESQRREGEMAP